MTNYQGEFLNKDEELSIKSEFIKYKDNGTIDSDIIDSLISLNQINGLATLYSCAGHKDKGDIHSYLVLKFAEELTYPITEALHTINENEMTSVEWNKDCYYTIDNSHIHVDNVIIIRGVDTNHYFNDLVTMLVD